MALQVSRETVWCASVKDRPGAVAELLAALAEAGALLEVVVARRAPEKPGEGVIFVAPLKGASQLRAARKLGFRKRTLPCVRVEGLDKRGQGAALTQALADAGINLRGLTASVIGRKFVAYIMFDDAADGAKAGRILRKLA